MSARGADEPKRDDPLLNYYEEELAFLQQMGRDFGGTHPGIASRLDHFRDPHVRLLLDAFALLAARIRLRIDEEFPEVTEALMASLYPTLTRHIPSASVVQFELDPAGKLDDAGVTITAESQLVSNELVDGAPCRFSTCYGVELWPLRVHNVEWQAPGNIGVPIAPVESHALRLELRCFPEHSFQALKLNTLRFHVYAEDTALAHTLYELLLRNCTRLFMQSSSGGTAPLISVELDRSNLRPVGFHEDHAILRSAVGRSTSDVSARSRGASDGTAKEFPGFRLVQEYFTLPEKFLFFDVSGFDRARAKGFGETLELIFLFSRFERGDPSSLLASISEDSFRLGCTPIVNLFPDSAVITLDHRRIEYQIVPTNGIPGSRPHRVVNVSGSMKLAGRSEPLRFEPFHGRRFSANSEDAPVLWNARWRRATSRERAQEQRGDAASETPANASTGTSDHQDLFLTFADVGRRTLSRDNLREVVVGVDLDCTNGARAARLTPRGAGSVAGDFRLLRGHAVVRRVMALRRPTPMLSPPPHHARLRWLVSQLSLNHLALDEGDGLALSQILRLHDFAQSRNVGAAGLGERSTRGIIKVRRVAEHRMVSTEHGRHLGRGHRVDVEFDESQYPGRSVFLFGSVLECFLGLAAPLNGFSVLRAVADGGKRILHEWPPRIGWDTLA